MKQSKAVVDARRTKIIDFMKDNQTINVNEMAERLNVSLPTIRRDLDYLYKNNVIERFYGGATLNIDNAESPEFDQNNRIKHALAKYTASCIKDNDIIFINTSSTALLVLKYLTNKRVTVITNNANAIHMEHNESVQVILTGGELRIPKYSMVGDMAINTINKIKANKCILGCNGISVESGVTTRNMLEVSINELMISKCCGEVYVLCHSSKVGKTSSFKSASIESIDYLITDKDANQYEVDQIRQNSTQVVLLEPLERIN